MRKLQAGARDERRGRHAEAAEARMHHPSDSEDGLYPSDQSEDGGGNNSDDDPSYEPGQSMQDARALAKRRRREKPSSHSGRGGRAAGGSRSTAYDAGARPGASRRPRTSASEPIASEPIISLLSDDDEAEAAPLVSVRRHHTVARAGDDVLAALRPERENARSADVRPPAPMPSAADVLATVARAGGATAARSGDAPAASTAKRGLRKAALIDVDSLSSDDASELGAVHADHATPAPLHTVPTTAAARGGEPAGCSRAAGLSGGQPAANCVAGSAPMPPRLSPVSLPPAREDLPDEPRGPTLFIGGSVQDAPVAPRMPGGSAQQRAAPAEPRERESEQLCPAPPLRGAETQHVTPDGHSGAQLCRDVEWEDDVAEDDEDAQAWRDVQEQCQELADQAGGSSRKELPIAASVPALPAYITPVEGGLDAAPWRCGGSSPGSPLPAFTAYSPRAATHASIDDDDAPGGGSRALADAPGRRPADAAERRGATRRREPRYDEVVDLAGLESEGADAAEAGSPAKELAPLAAAPATAAAPGQGQRIYRRLRRLADSVPNPMASIHAALKGRGPTGATAPPPASEHAAWHVMSHDSEPSGAPAPRAPAAAPPAAPLVVALAGERTAARAPAAEPASPQVVALDGADGGARPAPSRVPLLSAAEAAEVILRFPLYENATRCVELSRADVSRLQGPTFLNDSLVDFCLRDAEEHAAAAAAARNEPTRVHVLTSFWLPRARADSGKLPAEGAPAPAAAPGAAPRSRSAAPSGSLARWTKNIDLLEKDFIAIPVHEALHWALVVVAFPREAVHLPDRGAPPNESCASCLLYMDSLGASKRWTLRVIAEQLTREWTRRGYGRELGVPPPPFQRMPFVDFEIAKQTNSVDCGLFLAEAAEKLILNPPTRARVLTMLRKARARQREEALAAAADAAAERAARASSHRAPEPRAAHWASPFQQGPQVTTRRMAQAAASHRAAQPACVLDLVGSDDDEQMPVAVDVSSPAREPEPRAPPTAVEPINLDAPAADEGADVQLVPWRATDDGPPDRKRRRSADVDLLTEEPPSPPPPPPPLPPPPRTRTGGELLKYSAVDLFSAAEVERNKRDRLLQRIVALSEEFRAILASRASKREADRRAAAAPRAAAPAAREPSAAPAGDDATPHVVPASVATLPETPSGSRDADADFDMMDADMMDDRIHGTDGWSDDDETVVGGDAGGVPAHEAPDPTTLGRGGDAYDAAEGYHGDRDAAWQHHDGAGLTETAAASIFPVPAPVTPAPAVVS